MTEKRKTGRLLWEFLKGSRRYFAVGILFGLGMIACDMLIPQMIRIAVDSCIGSEPLPGWVAGIGGAGLAEWLRKELWAAPALIAVTAAAGALFRWLSTLENAKGGETLVCSMRDRLYAHIARLPYAWHMDNATGEIIQRCTSDVNVIKEFCSEQLYNLVRITLMILTGLVFMASMHIPLTLAALAYVPVIVGYSSVFHARIRDQFRECDENESVLSTIAQENLTGVRVVRAFGAEEREEEKFRAQNHIYTNAWMKLCGYLAVYWALGDLASGLQVLTVVLLGAWFCVKGNMTVGSYLAFISYNNMLVWPIRSLGRMISEMSKSGVSLNRIAEILEAEEEKSILIPESGNEQRAPGNDTGMAQDASENDTLPAQALSGDISFENVSFHFGASTVLKDISFTVPEGATVGILGSTGCGKSTLMYLLDRLYELPEGSGTIRIGGRDIRSIPIRQLRSSIGFVMQEPFLFSRTIGENICIVSGNDPALLAKASEIAHLTETIREFPDGYDTVVGERGVTLSGGQKQRVAIARMITQKAPVMIFDDSLSAVDAETDILIRQALRQHMQGATVFLISHRISSLMHADCIYVMDKGRIAQQGTHEELLKRNGLYAEIFAMQSLNEEETGGEAIGRA